MKPVETLTEATCSGCGSTYLKHPRARSTLCCRCKPLRRAKLQRILPLTNLAPNAIQSDTELSEYLDHDHLECLICHTRHKGLYAHLRMAHGMSTRDYKLKYGIPVTVGLVGKATRDKMQLSAQAVNEKMESGGYNNLKKARSKKGDTRVEWTAYQRKSKAEAMVESDRHPSKMEGLTVLHCHRCGGEVYVPATVSCALQCKVLCGSCKGSTQPMEKRHGNSD